MPGCVSRSTPPAWEAAVPYELTFIDFAKKEQKAPEYVQLNPNGRIPTLVDGEGEPRDFDASRPRHSAPIGFDTEVHVLRPASTPTTHHHFLPPSTTYDSLRSSSSFM